MKLSKTSVLVLLLCLVVLLAWAPWMDDQAIHDRVLEERGRRDGTIVPENKIIGSEEALQELKEESQKRGITDGILVCDYKVQWLPFGRLVGSCEGAYYVTFYGQILP